MKASGWLMDMGYANLIALLKQEFGLNFCTYNTGGGEMCLRAVTETGHWVHITDATDSLSNAALRKELEVDGWVAGFGVSVFADDESYEHLLGVTDFDSNEDTAAVTLVGQALNELARGGCRS